MDEIDLISNFLSPLGFILIRANRKKKSFVPGVYIDGMKLRVFVGDLMSPGDILHEAGHVAVLPTEFRQWVKGDVEKSLKRHVKAYMETHSFHLDDGYTENPVMRALLQCGECEAQAWSYAAALAIGIPPKSVFHDRAYDGGGPALLEMFSMAAHFGVHGLQAGKMTTVRTYPKMLRWMQI